MWFAVTPPMVVKWPPAIKSPLGSTARASTVLSVPDRRAAHVEPFQLAMLLAATPPAVEKTPPASRSPLGSTASASTLRFIPNPKADHAEPFQREMLFTVV